MGPGGQGRRGELKKRGAKWHWNWREGSGRREERGAGG